MNNALFTPLKNSVVFDRVLSSIKKNNTLWVSGAVSAQKYHMTAAVLSETKRSALIIASSELKAKEIYEDMHYFMRENCSIYPSRDLIFYAADVKSPDITRQRLRVLDALRNETAPVVILSAEALLDRMIPPQIFERYRLNLSVGDACEVELLLKRLAQMGYERSSLAEGPGQVALRGGILDIFPAVAKFRNTDGDVQLGESQALRLEFFGDDIDSIRIIDSLSQRSVENAQSFEIYPVRELVFNAKRLQHAKEKIRAATEVQKKALLKNERYDEEKILSDLIKSTLENWSEDSAEADAFFPFFYEEECNLLDYFPDNTVIFFDSPNRITVHMDTVWAEYEESINHRLITGRLLPLQINVIMPWAQILHKTQKFARILLSSMSDELDDFPNATEVQADARSCAPLRSKPGELKEDLARWVDDGYLVAILAGSRRQGEQITASLNEMDMLARFTETLDGENLATNLVTVTRGTLSAGFEYRDIKLAVITDKEIITTEKSHRKHKSKSKSRRRQYHAETISHFTDLRIGDYIVHDNHGIGIFRGIEQVTSDGLSRDYLKLEYSDGGHLYVQTSQMDMIQKYIGGRETAKLSKLGGADWAKAKSRARQAVEILAEDLIKLYAERAAAKAHIYGTDTVWQSEFESQFEYNETDDQIAAIEDVKQDMESSRVMDRLICGDVGYGKTEIAIRAAFKAVQDGKQVAYLVPTTILAQQHYHTFTSRMKSYPITVERLSRFQSRKEQQETLKNLEKGLSDIVIGTHRLLSKDVKFKDLGLIIVDEEQRFGVGHKEKLKEMRSNVDVLTLTATPIPRTLHFSLTGIRDMSLLDEPPEERRPVQTYVMEYNAEFVRDAINRELARGGQVYYLHNRVRNIAEEASRVQELVPEARIAFAHGQMSETELENIMHDFVEGDVDVLVCTTIIETGLDIPNVNTIIIQNADYMGLSQLYQLRGRVGRSSRLAYAYLMYRRDKVLQEEAEKRLHTIREFTEFGAGFKIAMRDLEIRGAGNLLGQQQHGHMDSVGYDMYCKLLSEAVGELRGSPQKETHETNIDISVDAFIPPRLIPDEQQKLEIYKKISLISNQQDYHDVEEEIEDRYGNLPPPVINLLDVALMKAEARALGVISVMQKGLNIVVSFRPDAPVDPDKVMKTITQNPTRLLFTMSQNPYITIRAYKDEKPPEDGGTARIREIRALLESIK
ncbi:MAG: transcription-repair coupling factor [Clostridiales bacterium]|jgi:transcription-repair coupling factor (superfamily II helicase)|nr:transcription-repair coupling factor [Clostridiales bacterium]